MRILLVEDDMDMSAELQEYLQKFKHEVEIQSDGKSAWERIMEIFDSPEIPKPDVIISDIKMPGLSGIELLNKIRKNEIEVLVIVITGHGDLDLAIDALKLNAFDFLKKPFKLESLLYTINKIEGLLTPRHQFKSVLPNIRERIELQTNSKVVNINGVVQHLLSHLEPVLQKNHINTRNFGMCLYEAYTNAVVHGNLGIQSSAKEEDWDRFNQLVAERENQAEYSDRSVSINCQFDSHQIMIELMDQGAGFNQKELPDPTDPEALLLSGRGVFIIRNYMDEVRWNEKGNHIIMVKRFHSESGPES